MSEDRFSHLLHLFFNRSCTAAEKEELVQWIQATDDEALKPLLENIWNEYQPRECMDAPAANAILQTILQQGRRQQQGKVLGMGTLWSRIAVAAIFILLAGVGVYYLFMNREQGRSMAEGGVVQSINSDIAPPQSVHATLTLSDGRTIVLDSTGSGSLALQGNVLVVKKADGQLAYTIESLPANDGIQANDPPLAYNTLTVPRGSRIMQLLLADGTKVWLNSESSLRYPTSFTGNERKVEITGEAYFEVARDPTRRFLVTGGGAVTEVLGTHFNVNTYRDEGMPKVTLMEGSVRVWGQREDLSQRLKPGEQALVGGQEIRLVKKVDVDQVMAWKNGMFHFKDADLPTVMRQLARWYDVEVTYEGEIPPRRFEGKIQRDLNLSDVLQALAKSQVHVTIEGKKIVVKP